MTAIDILALHQAGPAALGLAIDALDTANRIPDLKQEDGLGYCNITKCCTKVCPEHITITDNAIIPLKERVVDQFFDTLVMLKNFLFKRSGK